LERVAVAKGGGEAFDVGFEEVAAARARRGRGGRIGGGGQGRGEHPAFVFGDVAFESLGGEEEAGTLAAALEVVGLDDGAVDDGEDEAVGEGMAEGLDEVEGEGRAAVVELVEEAEVGFEADALGEGGQLMHEEGVGEGEEGVQGIVGGVFLAAGPSHVGAIELHEAIEVGAGGGALDAIEGGEVRGGIDVVNGGGDGVTFGGPGRGSVVVGAIGIEDGDSVGDFGFDDGAGEGEGPGGVAIELKLFEAEVDVGAAGTEEGAAIEALAGEETELDAFFEEFGHGLGSYLDVAEQENGIEFVIREVEDDLIVFLDEKAVAGFA
jgi:hypothetical protein